MVAHVLLAALSPAVRRAVAVILVALLVGLYFRTFVLRIVAIPSDSMAPALLAGDRVVVTRWVETGGLPRALAALLPVRPPAVGDVLLFRSPENRRMLLAKRCVALGGERFGADWVPAGTLILLGDARARSHDSRAFGPVETGAVVGRIALVLWSREPGGGARAARWFEPVR